MVDIAINMLNKTQQKTFKEVDAFIAYFQSAKGVLPPSIKLETKLYDDVKKTLDHKKFLPPFTYKNIPITNQ